MASPGCCQLAFGDIEPVIDQAVGWAATHEFLDGAIPRYQVPFGPDHFAAPGVGAKARAQGEEIWVPDDQVRTLPGAAMPETQVLALAGGHGRAPPAGLPGGGAEDVARFVQADALELAKRAEKGLKETREAFVGKSFEAEHQTLMGGRRTRLKGPRVSRRYQDKDGNWKSSESFSRNEIPLAID
ncbi:MAG: hypothetical protein ACODAJ_04510 [Planctomycetota bacterium]